MELVAYKVNLFKQLVQLDLKILNQLILELVLELWHFNALKGLDQDINVPQQIDQAIFLNVIVGVIIIDLLQVVYKLRYGLFMQLK